MIWKGYSRRFVEHKPKIFYRNNFFSSQFQKSSNEKGYTMANYEGNAGLNKNGKT